MAKQIKKTTRKKRVTKPKVVTTPEIEQELIVELDDLFDFDEVNLDDVLKTNTDDVTTSIQEVKRSDADKIIEQANADAATKEAMEFYKGVYMEHPFITDSFEVFSLKFRYFLLTENIMYQHISIKKIQKFIKVSNYMDVNEIKKVLLIVNL